MKKVVHSTLSIILCLIMVLGLFPSAIVFADDEPVVKVVNSVLTAYEGSAAGVEIEVTGINLTYQWQAKGSRWLDLEDNHAYKGTKTPHFQYQSNIGWAAENDWYGAIPFRCKISAGNKSIYSQEFMFNFIEREPLKEVVVKGLNVPYYGQTPDYTVDAGDDAYSISKVEWFGPGIKTNSVYYPPMNESSKFVAGNYFCRVYVEAKEPYKIDNNTNAYLDSTETASHKFVITPPAEGTNGMDTYFVDIPFTAKEAVLLTGGITFTSATRCDTLISIALGGVVSTIEKDKVHFQWQISEDGSTWTDIVEATSINYTPTADDVGKQIRLVISADGYLGEIVSEAKTVDKKLNTSDPVVPMLNSIDPTTLELINRQENQEYIYRLTEESDYNQIDWSSDTIPEDNTVSDLPSRSLVYVYTRIAPTETEDSFYVARNSIYLNDANYLSNIELEGYTSYGSRNTIHVPKNESVTININKNPFDADKWSNFKFKTPYTSSLITLSVTEEIVSGSTLPESITITAGDTTGAIMFGAYYNDVAMNYGTWQVVVYDPENLPVSMLKPKLEQNIPGLSLTVGDSAMPNYDAQSAELTDEEAKQFDLIWQVCSQAPTTAWGSPTFGEENEYLKVDPTTGLVTAKAEIPEDANDLYRRVYLFAARKSDSSKAEMTSYKVTVYPVGAVLVEGVMVSPENMGLVPGGSAELIATLFPANAEATADFTWSSSDETIATVDENGKVTALKEGDVVITATHKDSGKEGSCNVTISNNTISLAQATLTAPAVDSTPDMTIGVPKDVNYTASIEYWCLEGNDENPLTSLDAFEAGKKYDVRVKFIATNGYLFTDKTHFSLNGQEVTVESTNGTEAIVSKTFECADVAVEVLRGDVNGDEKITMEDVVIIQKGIAKLVDLKDNEKLASDVNFDEKTTMEDVVLIQKYIAKLINSFDKK